MTHAGPNPASDGRRAAVARRPAGARRTPRTEDQTACGGMRALRGPAGAVRGGSRGGGVALAMCPPRGRTRSVECPAPDGSRRSGSGNITSRAPGSRRRSTPGQRRDASGWPRVTPAARTVLPAAAAVLVALGWWPRRSSRTSPGSDSARPSVAAPEEPPAAALRLLPDRRLTPGAVRPVTATEACRGDLQAVPRADAGVPRQVFARYGIDYRRAAEYELDFLITPELGGAAERGQPLAAALRIDGLERLREGRARAAPAPHGLRRRPRSGHGAARHRDRLDRSVPPLLRHQPAAARLPPVSR